jgi:hypothetical protein
MKFIRAVSIDKANPNSLSYAKGAEPRELLNRLLSLMENAGTVATEHLVIAIIQEVDSWDILDDGSAPVAMNNIMETAETVLKKVGLK